LTAQTAPGSVPVKGANSFDKVQNFERKIESAIWTFDSGTKQLTPQWVNANRGTPKNYLLHMADESEFLEKYEDISPHLISLVEALVFTADKAEFRKVMNVTFSEVVSIYIYKNGPILMLDLDVVLCCMKFAIYLNLQPIRYRIHSTL
jgi:hypothetical protein